jgi:cytochrome c oxidase assembly protein subunit 15
MRPPRLRPVTYRKLTFAALVSLAIIVVTGALVRLTDSGLGCSDWPRCNASKVIDVSSSHAAIEQINRLFTGLVALAVVLAVAGSLVRVPRRRDLTWLSLSLVVGVIGQAVVGGIVVLTDLNPIAVQQHFLLSMVILAAALYLHRRATLGEGERWAPSVEPATMRLVWAVTGLATLALVTGTIVTGTGPHSGQHKGEYVRRFGFTITSVARVHSTTVIVMLAVALLLVWRLRTSPDRRRLENALSGVLFLGFLQGLVGYVQYFSDVPVTLVGIHVALATGLWLAIVNLLLVTRQVVSGSAEGGEAPADVVELADGLLDDLPHGTH